MAQTRVTALLGVNRDQIRYRIEKFKLETNSGWNTALEIKSADGEKVVLRFRPTEVDH